MSRQTCRTGLSGTPVQWFDQADHKAAKQIVLHEHWTVGTSDDLSMYTAGDKESLAVHWVSAISENAVLEDALADCAGIVQSELGAEVCPDLIVVFASPHFDDSYERIPHGLRNHFPAARIIGCSGAGVIGAGKEIEKTPGLSLTAAVLPGVQAVPFHVTAAQIPTPDDPPDQWSAMVGVTPDDDPHFILLLDPFSVSAEAMISGLDYAFPEAAKIGGLASAGRRPSNDVLFLDDQCYREGAVGLSLHGDIVVDTVVAQGCKPIGAAMRITAARDNVLLEVDGNPSIRMLESTYESLTESDQALIQNSLFLGIAMDPLQLSVSPGDFLIRNVIGADPNNGALYIGARLHEGQLVQFHVHDADTSAADLRSCLESYVRDVHGSPAAGALLFSCVGRGTNLYQDPDHDVGIFQDIVGDLPVGGFFCNGEVGPVGGVTYLHGFTSCFGLFRPKVVAED